jgi:hypothetical protein
MSDQQVLGVVGPQTRAPDGAEIKAWRGRYGESSAMNVRGIYSEMAARRRIFIGSTPAAGVTVPIFSNTTQQFVLHNPIGSGKLFHVLRTRIGYISGTMVAGHFCYATNTLLTNAVSGTAALIQSARLQDAASPSGSAARLVTAATVVAMTYLMPHGVSQVAQTAAQTNAPWQQIDDLNGSICIPPGGALALAANAAAFVVAALGIEWEEVDE